MTLYILPNLLDPAGAKEGVCPQVLDEIIPGLDGLICENEKIARRYLKLFSFPEGKSFRDLKMETLSEHTDSSSINKLLDPLYEGETWGLISDAGLPCIADPGSDLVAAARKRGIKIVAIPGPSSVFLALQLSGLRAQAFHFHGYLPRKEEELTKRLKELAKRSQKERALQVFIEAPYRNDRLLETLLKNLPPSATLSVAVDLTMPTEKVITQKVSLFKAKDINKKPAIFIFKY